MTVNLKQYYEWLMMARRWDKVNNFSGPMSTWTNEMINEYGKATQESEYPDLKIPKEQIKVCK